MAKITNVNIKTEFITLGQMLKFVDLVSSGSEQKQFIQRMDHPFDKRAKQIVLTQKGWEVHTAVENQIEENEKILLEGFSESEKEIYLGFLKKSLNNLSKEVKKC